MVKKMHRVASGKEIDQLMKDIKRWAKAGWTLEVLYEYEPVETTPEGQEWTTWKEGPRRLTITMTEDGFVPKQTVTAKELMEAMNNSRPLPWLQTKNVSLKEKMVALPVHKSKRTER